MLSRREPPPSPDEALDAYRAGVARVYDGDTLVGHLLTRVDVWWETEGPWWRRRHASPTEKIDWLLSFDQDYKGRHPDGWDQGVPIDGGDLADLEADRFTYRGRIFRLEWLQGE